MATSIGVVYELYRTRKAGRGKVYARMSEIRDQYNGDIVIPLPELSANEKPAIPNLLQQGLDQMGSRIASTSPDVNYPPLRPGIQASAVKAQTRRKANLGWWDNSKMTLQIRRRSRHLIGYGATIAQIRPNFSRTCPEWVTRDPMDSYPSPPKDIGDITPHDCVFSYTQSGAQLARTFNIPIDPGVWSDKRYEVLEYVDDVETVIVIVGPGMAQRDMDTFSGIGKEVMVLEPMTMKASGSNGLGKMRPVGGRTLIGCERIPNRAGICPVVSASRITLDRVLGQYDGMTGLFQTEARMMALEVLAVEQGIFPDEWLVARPNEAPQIITQANGRAGIVGVVSGGAIEQMSFTPGQQSYPTMDRLERAQRQAGGIPAEFGGECVDETTQILTTDGWKHHDEITVGTEVLTLNHDSGLSEWKPVEAMNRFPAQAREMLHMEGQRFSSLTTMNHRWPVLSRWNGERQWRESNALTSNHSIPTAAFNADLPTEAKWTDALVETVAWFYTEGSVRLHNSVPSGGQISQSTKKGEYVARIRAALNSLFGEATQTPWRLESGCGQGGVGHDGLPRWREEKPAANGVIKWALSNDAVKHLLHVAPDKVPTFDWLRQLTQAQLELFVNVSLMADNCGAARLGQKDERRTEAFAFAVLLCGQGTSYQTRVHTDERPGWPDVSTAYIASVKKRRSVNPVENAQRTGATFAKVMYDGMVWCPTTENGTWLARRNGTVYFTGNSSTNIRTGRRGDSVLSATIDFTIQEAQDVLTEALQEENVRAVAIAKGYFGNDAVSFYVRWKKAHGPVDYVANEIFETDNNVVSFSHAGADANSLIVGIGQRIGLGMMSVQTGQELDPLIDDSETEHDRVISEALEKASLQSLQQQASTGGIAPHDMAAITFQVKVKHKTLYEAIDIVHQAAQARQSASAQPGAGGDQPGLAAGMPAAGGAGDPTQAPDASDPTVAPPPQSLANISQLLANLHRPQQAAASPGAPTTQPVPAGAGA